LNQSKQRTATPSKSDNVCISLVVKTEEGSNYSKHRQDKKRRSKKSQKAQSKSSKSRSRSKPQKSKYNKFSVVNNPNYRPIHREEKEDSRNVTSSTGNFTFKKVSTEKKTRKKSHKKDQMTYA